MRPGPRQGRKGEILGDLSLVGTEMGKGDSGRELDMKGKVFEEWK